MTGAGHGTVTAVTAAGRFPLTLVFNYNSYDPCDNGNENKRDYYVTEIVCKPLYHSRKTCDLRNLRKLICFLVFLNEQHIDDESERRYCEDQTDNIYVTSEQTAELVDHE